MGDDAVDWKAIASAVSVLRRSHAHSRLCAKRRQVRRSLVRQYPLPDVPADIILKYMRNVPTRDAGSGAAAAAVAAAAACVDGTAASGAAGLSSAAAVALPPSHDADAAGTALPAPVPLPAASMGAAALADHVHHAVDSAAAACRAHVCASGGDRGDGAGNGDGGGGGGGGGGGSGVESSARACVTAEVLAALGSGALPAWIADVARPTVGAGNDNGRGAADDIVVTAEEAERRFEDAINTGRHGVIPVLPTCLADADVIDLVAMVVAIGHRRQVARARRAVAEKVCDERRGAWHIV